MAIVPLEPEQVIYIGFLSQQCGSRVFTEERMRKGFNCSYLGNPGGTPAECVPANCPIARPATLADLTRSGHRLYRIYKGDHPETHVPDENLMVQHSRFE